MEVTKLIEDTNQVKPIIAALPYQIAVEDSNSETAEIYNPELQRTLSDKSRKSFSISRVNESICSLFQSKSDNQKAD